MKHGNGRIIFEGVRETFNYKALFVEYVFGVRQARAGLFWKVMLLQNTYGIYVC